MEKQGGIYARYSPGRDREQSLEAQTLTSELRLTYNRRNKRNLVVN